MFALHWEGLEAHLHWLRSASLTCPNTPPRSLQRIMNPAEQPAIPDWPAQPHSPALPIPTSWWLSEMGVARQREEGKWSPPPPQLHAPLPILLAWVFQGWARSFQAAGLFPHCHPQFPAQGNSKAIRRPGWEWGNGALLLYRPSPAKT